MKILVTGALGLVGGVVYRYFSASPQRFDVYALSRRRGHSERTDEQTRVTVPEDRLIGFLDVFSGTLRRGCLVCQRRSIAW